jgi:hypothetical protein
MADELFAGVHLYQKTNQEDALKKSIVAFKMPLIQTINYANDYSDVMSNY